MNGFQIHVSNNIDEDAVVARETRGGPKLNLMLCASLSRGYFASSAPFAFNFSIHHKAAIFLARPNWYIVALSGDPRTKLEKETSIPFKKACNRNTFKKFVGGTMAI